MMRKLLFRGKRLDNGEWVEGDLMLGEFIGNVEDAEYHQEGMGCGIEDACIDDRYEACEYGYNQAVEAIFQNIYQVDPTTISQYTGLLDSKGVKIFEGQTIKLHQFLFDGDEYESELVAKVVYSDELVAFCLTNIKHEGIAIYMGYESSEDAENEIVPICNFYGLHEESWEVHNG